ncbi:hypothetical protein [Methylosinus sporium]|uniref:hypothetical protein n=1 Tax=Methylosinus sporium TaxID=428 RepID=UPI00383BA242
MTKPLHFRLEEMASKISLAGWIASDERALGDVPRDGFYIMLHDMSVELKEISEAVHELTGGQERTGS